MKRFTLDRLHGEKVNFFTVWAMQNKYDDDEADGNETDNIKSKSKYQYSHC